jgi:ATP/maltotriose-dependent transcriptional regulator MalT
VGRDVFRRGVQAARDRFDTLSAQVAVHYCEQAATLAHTVGDRWALALSLGVLAHVAIARGEFDRAAHLAEDVLRLFAELDDAWGLAMTHTGLGVAAIRRGAYDRAMLHLEMALEAHRRSGDPRGLPWSCMPKPRSCTAP